MKTSLDCLPCFITQTLRTVRRFGGDAQAEERAARVALRLLAGADLGLTPPQLMARVYPEIHACLGTSDPYAAIKRADNERMLALLPRFAAVVAAAADPLRTAVQLALAGNVIDLGAAEAEGLDFERMVERLLERGLVRDEIEELARALRGARRVLYLADNAGELVLDRLLIETLPPAAQVTLAVRGGPIINDVTVEDARTVLAGCPRPVAVIEPGVTLPGVDLARSSAAFRRAFDTADLIISKGQGNFETLDAPAPGRPPVCFIFVVKCSVVAGRLGLRIGDPLVVFQRPARPPAAAPPP